MMPWDLPGMPEADQFWRQPEEVVYWQRQTGMWVSREDGDPLTWVGVRQTPESAPWPWIAVDWDNKTGDPEAAAKIRRLRPAFHRRCREMGIRLMDWPSKSRERWPLSESGHTFLYLSGLTLAEQTECALACLDRAWADEAGPMPRDASWGVDREACTFPVAGARRSYVIGICSREALPVFLEEWRKTTEEGT